MSREPDMSGVHECGGDAAAYVLGALNSEESEAFRAHLATCSICQEEVESFGHVGDVLGMAAPPHRPSKSLRKQVMKEVHADARARKTRAVHASAARGPRGYGFSRTVFAGVMAAALAAAVFAGAQIASPGSSVRVFHATVGDAEVRLVSDSYAELTVHHLRQPTDNRIYEVWLQNSRGELAPTKALFSVTSSGDGVVDVPGNLKDIKAVMVTEEPAGGRKVPTTKPVIVAPVD
jgi:anti-sigma-K factor RskA